jgi:hypothetical protein
MEYIPVLVSTDEGMKRRDIGIYREEELNPLQAIFRNIHKAPLDDKNISINMYHYFFIMSLNSLPLYQMSQTTLLLSINFRYTR